MDSDDIRAQIHEALERDARTGTAAGLLEEHLHKTGVSWTAANRTVCLDFVKAYIAETPDIMDAVFTAASETGVLDEVRPIFDAAFSYWAEENDYIPDSLGLFGLTDDAYLTHVFMETVSSRQADRTGYPLLSIDLGPPNRVMRDLIGEPVASALDAAVTQTVDGQTIQGALHRLERLPALSLEIPGYGSLAAHHEMKQKVDVRLGTMGAR